jgi:rare lipoprotein A
MPARSGTKAAGLVVALITASPALAEAADPALAFVAAFGPFELTEADAALDPETSLAASARFAQAPLDEPRATLGTGRASYYGAGFAGRPTASGEHFNPAGLTAAHRTLAFGTLVRVTNLDNGRSVVVRINDRGPFHGKRVIDLSHEAARRIGLIDQGHGEVRLSAP